MRKFITHANFNLNIEDGEFDFAMDIDFAMELRINDIIWLSESWYFNKKLENENENGDYSKAYPFFKKPEFDYQISLESIEEELQDEYLVIIGRQFNPCGLLEIKAVCKYGKDNVVTRDEFKNLDNF